MENYARMQVLHIRQENQMRHNLILQIYHSLNQQA